MVEAQQSELSRAVYGSGEYLLPPHMLSFQVDQLSWHHMTAKQRIAHIHKMVMSTQTLSREEGRPHIQVEDRRLRKLSVAAEDTELPTVPQATAQNIWEKAERLLSDLSIDSRARSTERRPYQLDLLIHENGDSIFREICKCKLFDYITNPN